MRLHEDTVDADGDTCFGHHANHLGLASRHTRRLVGLLERMRHVEHDRHPKALHDGDVAEVDHQVLVSEHGAAFGEHHLVVA